MSRLIVVWLLALIWLPACSLPSLPSLPSFSLFSSSPKADPTAEALYDEGIRAFNDKKYVRAIDSFSKIRSDHPFSPLINQVDLKIADAYYLNQQFPDAINAFKEFQTMHPSNENIPFVILRLGQAHFDQFTSTDRDQKNTEIAKGYFETVLSKYPNSPEAAQAREKLAKCLDYLAEHEFNVAHFYYQQEKYPAARDRFEEIVRKYKDTPAAVKSLFYLGESYRNEKNAVRAALAYEALIQHYPQSKFAAEANSQLALVEKEKRDPLALLLMRDRRPTTVASPEVKEDPALAKLRDLNLVAKTEVVHEQPGDEKGFLRRVADKLNPFSASDNGKKEEKKDETAMELLTNRKQASKKEEESSGFLAALWPFGSKDTKETAPARSGDGKSSALVAQLDDSLKQKGIDVAASQAELKPPPADLPKGEISKPQPTTDTAALLGAIDDNLTKGGKNVGELPPPPEPAEAFKDIAATQARIAKATQGQAAPESQTSEVLSSIDQKLKARGVEPSRFEKPPTAEELKAASAQKPQPKNVELEPKLALEKGPLFLSPSEASSQDKAAANQAVKTPDSIAEGAKEESPSRVLVKGPVQTQAIVGAKPVEPKSSSSNQDEEPKGVLDQIRQDIENASKVLNPFRW
jgi:outer membrane protein assembly factor BamD